MKRICIVPHWVTHWGNRIFDSRGQLDAIYEAFSKLRKVALSEGYQLDTIDRLSTDEADAFWFIDFPRKRSFFEEILAAKKETAKIVLHVLESPLQVRQSHSVYERKECDFVLSYGKNGPEKPNYLICPIPNYLELEDSGISFADRRCSVMINTNKQEGWLGSGAAGSKRFPGVGKYMNRWRVPLIYRFFPAWGELYSWRRAFARTADRWGERVLDIYGEGWNGEYISWLPRPPPKPFLGAGEGRRLDAEKTKIYSEKIPLLGHYRFGIAVENYRGSEGYVSEKMIDVLRAGAVPVYLGDESIADAFPAGSFVDVRDYKNHTDLIQFLVNCPEDEWERMRAIGRAFLASPESQVRAVNTFVQTAMKVIRQL